MKGIKTKGFLAPIAFLLLIGCSDSDPNNTDPTVAEDTNMDQVENDPGGSSMNGRFSSMTMNEEIVMRDSETNLEWVNGLTPSSTKPETGCHPMPPGLATDGVIAEAQFFCENLDFATHTDWRVPSTSEIQKYTADMKSSGLIPFYQNPQCPRVVGIDSDGAILSVSTVNTHNTPPTGTINDWEARNAGVRCVRGIGAGS